MKLPSAALSNSRPQHRLPCVAELVVTAASESASFSWGWDWDSVNVTSTAWATRQINETFPDVFGGPGGVHIQPYPWHDHNWWALLALALVLATATGNILVCLAITWERRLQNVTNYFLMSLAITDLMVAILVMPVGILTLVRGECHPSSAYAPSRCACRRLQPATLSPRGEL